VLLKLLVFALAFLGLLAFLELLAFGLLDLGLFVVLGLLVLVCGAVGKSVGGVVATMEGIAVGLVPTA
jgi:hypothetical protein